jgi:hypothetical protein
MNAPQTIRPRRSVLYVPGANPKALAKAAGLPADGLIFDLEDAVLPEAKPTARTAVIERVAAGGFGPREVVIRINGLDTAWGIRRPSCRRGQRGRCGTAAQSRGPGNGQSDHQPCLTSTMPRPA